MTGRDDYYDEKLAAQSLRRCYEIAPPRTKRYLDAELDHVLGHIEPGDSVLDLGCGYGRTLPRLSSKARHVVGIDTSMSSLRTATADVGALGNCRLACMDAVHLGFGDCTFDLVVCIQNGISAFHVDRHDLMSESLRVVRQGGTALFSTYSEKFWADRLEWFELQSREGLLGEIDYGKTGNGVIVCVDGFEATTVRPEEFIALAGRFDADARIIEVDDSSVFCELVRRGQV